MKTVRLAGKTVAEIIPEYGLPVAEWYGEAFAAKCVEAPDEVEQHWQYDPDTGEFSPPSETSITPKPSAEERLAALESAMLAMMGGMMDV